MLDTRLMKSQSRNRSGSGRRQTKKKAASKKAAKTKSKPPAKTPPVDDWHPSRPLPNEKWEAVVLLIFQATRTGPDCTCNHTDAYQRVYPKTNRKAAQAAASRLLSNVMVAARLAWLVEEADRRALGSVEEADRILWQKVKGKPTDYITVLPDGTRVIEAGPDSPNPHAIKRLKARRDLSGEGDGNADADFTDIEVEGLAALTLYYRRHGLLTDKMEVTGTLKDALDEAERRGHEASG